MKKSAAFNRQPAMNVSASPCNSNFEGKPEAAAVARTADRAGALHRGSPEGKGTPGHPAKVMGVGDGKVWGLQPSTSVIPLSLHKRPEKRLGIRLAV